MSHLPSPAVGAVAERRSTWRSAVPPALMVVAVALLFVTPASAMRHAAPSGLPPASAASHVTPAALVAPSNGSGTFNPPCYKVDTTVCVQIANQNESDMIPPVGSFVSAVEPNCSSDLPLVIKSHNHLDWTNNPFYGPNSPIALNVSGKLWNGDQYYSIYDGTVWHSNNPTHWWSGPNHFSQDLTYPWHYNVVFSAKATNGAPNFYPGMTAKWWIYLTYNVSTNATLRYIHHVGPAFQFTCSGAWPFSPYPGSYQYAGSSATFEDVALTVTPRSPNFNDSVVVTLNTTQADVLSNATIGPNTYLDLAVISPNGTLVATRTLPFPVTVTGGFGAVTSVVVIPAAYAQLPGAVVTYTLSIRDVANDLIVAPATSYVVGGNGSYLSGIFTDDLGVSTSPASVGALSAGLTQVVPGLPVNITLVSRNPGTAISAAEVVATVNYPLLHETAVLHSSFKRVSSIDFTGQIPGMPIGSYVNFSVYAWDFTQRLEISPGYGYFTPDFYTYVPVVPTNSTFFYVFVYDNGSQTWVTGAKVQILGDGDIYNSVSNTTFGVAYPNASGAPYTPLLVAANATYHVYVSDPYFVPPTGHAPETVNATILGLHVMTARATLVAGSNYWIVQEANAIVFWLNTTAPSPAFSPAANGGGKVPIGGIIGAVGAGVVSIPLVLWWRQIRARRKEEEKRVTL